MLLIAVGVALVTGVWNDFRLLGARRLRQRRPVAAVTTHTRRTAAMRLLSRDIRRPWRALTTMGTALVLLFLLALGRCRGRCCRSAASTRQRCSSTSPTIHDRAVAGPAADVRRVLQLLVHRDLRAVVHLARRLPHPAHHRAHPQPAGHPGSGALQPQPAAPARLRHRDQHADEVAGRILGRLRGWRTTTRQVGEITEISAEKGYLREFGNIVFHFSLLGLLAAVAVGKIFGYEGNVIVIADGGPGFCSASPAAFDSFRAGNRVDGTSLYPMCVRVNNFQARYLPSGQATSFAADIDYQAGRT